MVRFGDGLASACPIDAVLHLIYAAASRAPLEGCPFHPAGQAE